MPGGDRAPAGGAGFAVPSLMLADDMSRIAPVAVAAAVVGLSLVVLARSRRRRPRAVVDQALGPGALSCAISWTGGKDCNLALLAAWRDPALRVVALVVFRPEDAVFRAHPLSLMAAQADALGLPLHHVVIPKTATSYKSAYVEGMRKLRSEHGIRVIGTGDMDLVGSMARNWIEECGEEAGISAFLPLWQADREACLRQLIREVFDVKFTCVKSPWFDASWIGRSLDTPTIDVMAEMAALPQNGDAMPLDLGGERGEYHTMVVDGPLYFHRVAEQFGPPIELNAQPGQKHGERWWTVGEQIFR